MSDATRKRMWALEQQWRAESIPYAEGPAGSEDDCVASVLEKCADELAAALAETDVQPDGWIVEGHIEDGVWRPVTARASFDDAEWWIAANPRWQQAGARIRAFVYTDTPGVPAAPRTETRTQEQNDGQGG